MKTVDNALDHFLRQTDLLPFAQSVLDLYGGFRELANSRFLIRGATWLNAFELAAISKWVYLCGHGGAAHRVDWPSVLNAYKELWRVTEEATDYPDDPSIIAAFVLRFVDQQLIWNITPEKMQTNFSRTRGIFGGTSIPATNLRFAFENATKLEFEEFLKAAHVLFGLFMQHVSIPSFQMFEALQSRFSTETISRTLGLLGATRGRLKKYYDHHAAAPSSHGVIYEFNPLLRFPIILRDDQYSCVFPELVNYAATRGVYFLIADAAGASFNVTFADAFEAYVVNMCAEACGKGQVLTEAQERNLGWRGKTNDVSLLLGDTAILFECKNSGLFSVSKRSADPMDLAADIRKNLANAEKRKGLFQLHDKIDCIRSGQIPSQLSAKYAAIQKLYPVLLLYDEIWFANRPETLRNLIDSELAKHGISTFDYQIWHVDELEILLRSVPREELGKVVHEKFHDPRSRSLDLSLFLSERYNLNDLNVHLFLPPGKSKAMAILKQLADSDAA
jgi:hypothetical protein